MQALYRCDQCGHEEWRGLGQEPWLCLVCGWMRWQVVTTADDPGDETGSDSGEDRGDLAT